MNTCWECQPQSEIWNIQVSEGYWNVQLFWTTCGCFGFEVFQTLDIPTIPLKTSKVFAWVTSVNLTTVIGIVKVMQTKFLCAKHKEPSLKRNVCYFNFGNLKDTSKATNVHHTTVLFFKVVHYNISRCTKEEFQKVISKLNVYYWNHQSFRLFLKTKSVEWKLPHFHFIPIAQNFKIIDINIHERISYSTHVFNTSQHRSIEWYQIHYSNPVEILFYS